MDMFKQMLCNECIFVQTWLRISVVVKVWNTCITTRFIFSHYYFTIVPHTNTNAHKHTHTRAHTNTRTTHARTQTHTPPHTHAYFRSILSLALFFVCMYRLSRHGWTGIFACFVIIIYMKMKKRRKPRTKRRTTGYTCEILVYSYCNHRCAINTTK